MRLLKLALPASPNQLPVRIHFASADLTTVHHEGQALAFLIFFVTLSLSLSLFLALSYVLIRLRKKT
jgi:hypothetical protein